MRTNKTIGRVRHEDRIPRRLPRRFMMQAMPPERARCRGLDPRLRGCRARSRALPAPRGPRAGQWPARLPQGRQQRRASGAVRAAERVAFDDGWSSGQVRFEDLLSRPTTVSEDRAKSVLTFNQSPDLGFDRSVNPYQGCEHGCTYCYARPSHAFMGLSAGLDFNPAVCQVRRCEAARRRPAQAELPGRADLLGTNTDPYPSSGGETDGGDRRARHLPSSDNHRHQIGRDPARSRSAGGHGRARVGAGRDFGDHAGQRAVAADGAAMLVSGTAAGGGAALSDARAGSGHGLPGIPGLNDSELETILARARKPGRGRRR